MQQRRQINKRFLGQSRGFSALFFGYKLYVLCTSSLSLYIFIRTAEAPLSADALLPIPSSDLKEGKERRQDIHGGGKQRRPEEPSLLVAREKRDSPLFMKRVSFNIKGDRNHGQIPC